MHIYVNGRFLTQRRSGMQRFAEELLCALDDAMEGSNFKDRVSVLVPKGERRDVALKNIPIRPVGSTGGHIWEQTSLLRASRSGLLLNFMSSGPLLHRRQMATFHDAAVFVKPEHFSWQYRMAHRSLRPLLARSCRAVATVSKFSAGELSRFLGVPANAFTILSNGCDHILRTPADKSILQRLDLIGSRFIMTVGNQTPNKNLETAIRAFEAVQEPGLKLVIVGAGDSRIFGQATTTNRSDIIMAGYISDAELRGLYEGAELLIFPSIYEGFGIPPMEAMALGCPVVASNTSAIPEVTGPAAKLVEPYDVAGFASQIQCILRDNELRSSLIAAGHDQASKYNWQKTASDLCALIEEL